MGMFLFFFSSNPRICLLTSIFPQRWGNYIFQRFPKISPHHKPPLPARAVRWGIPRTQSPCRRTLSVFMALQDSRRCFAPQTSFNALATRRARMLSSPFRTIPSSLSVHCFGQCLFFPEAYRCPPRSSDNSQFSRIANFDRFPKNQPSNFGPFPVFVT